MRRPKATLGSLLLLLLCSFSPAHPRSPEPDVNDYASLARQAVADFLEREGRSVEQLHIELVGPPVVPGDHASLHRPPILLAPNESALSGYVIEENWGPIPAARVSVASQAATGERESHGGKSAFCYSRGYTLGFA